jgi:hypothetical protein
MKKVIKSVVVAVLSATYRVRCGSRGGRNGCFPGGMSFRSAAYINTPAGYRMSPAAEYTAVSVSGLQTLHWMITKPREDRGEEYWRGCPSLPSDITPAGAAPPPR